MIQNGIIGIDYKTIDHDKINNLEVKVGLIDTLIGGGNTGDILIIFSGNKSTLQSVENPYEVLKQLKEVSYDIKTDVHFPNQYRPDNNPGYKTGYKTKTKQNDEV